MALTALPPKHAEKDGDFHTLLTEWNAMKIRQSTRTLPAEWSAQSGIWLTWPHKETDWNPILEEITKTYIRLAYEIAQREKLIIVHPHSDEVQELLQSHLPTAALKNIIFYSCPTNDTWARDHGVITVRNNKEWELVDCAFNGWGNKFPAEKDNAITSHLYKSHILHGKYIDALDFILEGGSIESDGAGVILTTAHCVCSESRGHNRSRQFIEQKFQELFGAQKVLWLTHGHLEGDDTDGHIDTLARFCPGNVIAYVKCDDPSDSHFQELQLMESELQNFSNISNQPYTLIPLPMAPVIYDEDGTRLPATYANFLILSKSVIYPTYGVSDLDLQVENILRSIFPHYELIGIDAQVLIKQHGSIHCAAMQLPYDVVK